MVAALVLGVSAGSATVYPSGGWSGYIRTETTGTLDFVGLPGLVNQSERWSEVSFTSFRRAASQRARGEASYQLRTELLTPCPATIPIFRVDASASAPLSDDLDPGGEVEGLTEPGVAGNYTLRPAIRVAPFIGTLDSFIECQIINRGPVTGAFSIGADARSFLFPPQPAAPGWTRLSGTWTATELRGSQHPPAETRWTTTWTWSLTKLEDADYDGVPDEEDDCPDVFDPCSGGTIIVEKQTNPDGAPQVFSFDASYDADGFPLWDGLQNDSGLLAEGSYSVSETVAAGWDLTSAICDDGSAPNSIALAAGETVTCTFTNTKRGSVTLKKTTDGVVDPSKDILFVLTGPGLPAGGVTRSTFGDQDGVLDFGTANLIPTETYKICESPVPAGFTSFWKLDGVIVSPYNPDASKTPPEDLGTRCYDFSVSPAQARAFGVDNSHPGGDPRTIGYWKNWNRCTGGNQAATAQKNGGAAAGFFLVEDLLPQTIGDFWVTTCQQAVKLLSKQDQAGRNKASDAAYELGAQLLASRFNLAAGAETCSAVQQAALDGQTLLDGINFTGSGDYLGSKSKDPKRTQALSIATSLDRYNNGNLC